MRNRLHRLAIRVYYEDTDFSGVVYHANYLRFLERGRTEMLRDLGIDQTALFSGAAPLAFAVTSMTIDFRRPALMDDLVDVLTEVAEVGGASLTLRQRLQRGEVLLVEANVRVAAVSSGRPVRLPAALAVQLRGSSSPAYEASAAP